MLMTQTTGMAAGQSIFWDIQCGETDGKRPRWFRATFFFMLPFFVLKSTLAQRTQRPELPSAPTGMRCTRSQSWHATSSSPTAGA